MPHDLKPCPFCNGAGILTGDHKAVKVNCELCGAECGPWYSAGLAGEAKAADVWNTRFPVQALVGEPE